MLDKGLKQRIVGALVLVALAVIFVPVLFNREDDGRHLAVEAPPMPEAPPVAKIEVDSVVVPEPEPVDEDEWVIENEPPIGEPPAVADSDAAEPVAPTPEPARPAEPVKRLDNNGLPVSWSIQLASLSNRASAEALEKTLRSQGYNAYIRTAAGMNRVFVGPLIERDEANRLRDQLHRQQKLDGFVLRFKPEQS